MKQVKPFYVCNTCGRMQGTPLLVHNEEWICGECLYLLEHPQAHVQPVVKPRNRQQKERLFDV